MKDDDSPHMREMDKRARQSVSEDAALIGRIALAILLLAALGYFLFG